MSTISLVEIGFATRFVGAAGIVGVGVGVGLGLGVGVGVAVGEELGVGVAVGVGDGVGVGSGVGLGVRPGVGDGVGEGVGEGAVGCPIANGESDVTSPQISLVPSMPVFLSVVTSVKTPFAP